MLITEWVPTQFQWVSLANVYFIVSLKIWKMFADWLELKSKKESRFAFPGNGISRSIKLLSHQKMILLLPLNASDSTHFIKLNMISMWLKLSDLIMIYQLENICIWVSNTMLICWHYFNTISNNWNALPI